MPSQSTNQSVNRRDGTSQADRLRPALDPDSVSVDERSLKDWLVFARQYANELVYFAVKDETVQAMGDWSGLLGTDSDLDEIVAFMRDPSACPPDVVRRYSRPHVVLFLTFLHLLCQAQDQLNTLTRRHLDYYFQQALAMTKRAGQPDHVNVLVDLSPDTEQYLLPAGTLLKAGPDIIGQDRVYRTDRDVVLNHAHVAELSSLYVDKRMTGAQEAREGWTGLPGEAVIKMLEMTHGEPHPGDPLPNYPEPPGTVVNYTWLQQLYALVNFVQTGLFLNFADFRELMRLKTQRDQADADWIEINQLLQKTTNRITVNPANSRDFDANFMRAVGEPPPNFNLITQVQDIYDLYEQRTRESVRTFIKEKLHFQEIDDFLRLMQIKVRIDNEWSGINRLLEQAGQKKRASVLYRLPADNPTAFDANLREALGGLVFPLNSANLDAYYRAFQVLERFFSMSVENFTYLMFVAEKRNPDASRDEWNKVYTILADAYREKLYAMHSGLLVQARANNPPTRQRFNAMVRIALDDPSVSVTDPDLFQKLKQFVTEDKQVTDLVQFGQNADRTQPDWNEVERILQGALRVRFAKSVAQKTEWLNLYAAKDATSVAVTLGVDAEAQSPRWKTFGRAPSVEVLGHPAGSEFGWAISAPILALSQGVRVVTVTLGFDGDRFDAAKIRASFGSALETEPMVIGKEGDPFRLQFSTKQGWVESDAIKIDIGPYAALTEIGSADPRKPLQALQFKVTFPETTDALAPLAGGADRLDGPWPVLRLMLRPMWQPPAQGKQETYVTPYQLFKDLELSSAHIKVSVQGLTPLQMQSDAARLEAGAPFEPFGPSPVIGSRFYLGHPEFIYKKLDSLKFNFEWAGAPNDVKSHYDNYAAITSADQFTAQISLVDNRLKIPLVKEAQLFALGDGQKPNTPNVPEVSTRDGQKPNTIDVPDVSAAARKGRPGYVYGRATDAVMGDDLLGWNRYLQWELNAPGFQFETYPILAAQKAAELAVAIRKDTFMEDQVKSYQVNAPYTPKVKQLTVDYSASIEIMMEGYTPGLQADRLFHIQPFGYAELRPDLELSPHARFLPQYDDEGELYIGMQGVQAPQNVALLFQMAEGSADPDLEPVPVHWSYLSGNRWISLDDGGVVQDSTRGLINSGIIELSLKPAEPNTLLPPQLYWIRAAISQHSDSVCDTVAIHAQAVSATFVDRDNAPDHLSQPLPPESITELEEPLATVSGIRQPYTSYGGKMAEQARRLYTRVSERLRHKNRALTLWDYEHMLLEEFPQIYKAKCLPADSDRPGEIGIVVIPDMKNKLPFNPFEPKVPADVIAAIETYFADKVPAYASVRVTNPSYVTVKVRFDVRFLPGRSEGYYLQRLNEDLNRFLSPWAYEDGAEIVIGGRIYANAIINFVEQQPYVDYVANIKLFSSENGTVFALVQPSPTEGYWVGTGQPDGVLVAARQHEIGIIPETGYEEQLFSGINYMKIELDFVVS